MATDYTDDLRLAHLLADDADSIAQARFRAIDLHVMSKPDLTPVTDADRAVELGAASGGKVPRSTWQNFPTDLEHFVNYFVAHEAHHRGQLVMIARQLGHPLPADVINGLWQWTARARE